MGRTPTSHVYVTWDCRVGRAALLAMTFSVTAREQRDRGGLRDCFASLAMTENDTSLRGVSETNDEAIFWGVEIAAVAALPRNDGKAMAVLEIASLRSQ